MIGRWQWPWRVRGRGQTLSSWWTVRGRSAAVMRRVPTGRLYSTSSIPSSTSSTSAATTRASASSATRRWAQPPTRFTSTHTPAGQRWRAPCRRPNTSLEGASSVISSTLFKSPGRSSSSPTAETASAYQTSSFCWWTAESWSPQTTSVSSRLLRRIV